MPKIMRKRRTWPEAEGNEIWDGVYSRNLKTGNTLIKFYHISRLDKENHISVSIDAESTSDQIQQICLMKILKKYR